MSHRSWGWALALGLAVTLLPSALGGQQVRGSLLETGNATPVPYASMALLDTAFTVVDQVLTNDDGAFLLRAPAPGSYYVLAEALGYAPRMDGILELGNGGQVTVEFYLTPRPIELDSLKVALTRVKTFAHLTDLGYYERQKMGFGWFIDPETIERRNPVTAFDLLRGIPDLRMDGPSFEGTRVYVMRGGERCNPKILIDGIPAVNDAVTAAGGPVVEEVESSGASQGTVQLVSRGHTGVVIEKLINIQDVAAVEVHTRTASVPLLYGGTQETCGVILLWTHLSLGKSP